MQNVSSKRTKSNSSKDFKLSSVGKIIFDKIIRSSGKFIGDKCSLTQLNSQALKSAGTCVVFLNEDFGAGVCISSKGLILTVAHAIEDIPQNGRVLAFSSGKKILFDILHKEVDLDLALLKITKEEDNINNINEDYSETKKLRNERQNLTNIADSLDTSRLTELTNDNAKFTFSSVLKSDKNPDPKEKIYCIGNPTDEEGKYTEFEPFHISFGRIKGYMNDEVFGDYEKGALKHSCWTYWGHSGGPIFNTEGKVIGLHNSWNSSTGTRHGVSLKAINKFLSDIDFEALEKI